MDYVVGSVAALISGNETPSRQRIVKRPLTPVKRQASPNVTPKSEFVDDRSIFLSPSVQKKKALIKRSPKRIFQNPDCNVTNENEKTSPEADKVKKHLNQQLELNDHRPGNETSTKKSTDLVVPSPKKKNNITQINNIKDDNDIKPSLSKKKKKNKNIIATEVPVDIKEYNAPLQTSPDQVKSPKKEKKKKLKHQIVNDNKQTAKTEELVEIPSEPSNSNKKNKKNNLTEVLYDSKENNNPQDPNFATSKKKGKKRKLKTKVTNSQVESNRQPEDVLEISPELNNNKKIKKSKSKTQIDNDMATEENENGPIKKKKNNIVNPNAITNKESDSEHESDNEILSENEENNKEALKPDEAQSSDEEETKVEKKDKVIERDFKADIERTIFVGNVPFSKKCKKEIKKIFNKHGPIETIRIRTVPVKDARTTPKLAVIKNEIHPERSTVNVYVKFKEVASVESALVENNTVLNDHHLRVTRSDTDGLQVDPRCSIFVGNLPFAIEDETLRAKFEGCGPILSVRIIRDKTTNAGKGFGYVNFESKDAVELALAMSEEDLSIKNRILRVQRSTQMQHKHAKDKQVQPGQSQRNFQSKSQGQLQNRNKDNYQNRNQNKNFQNRNQGQFQNRNQGNFQNRNQGNFQNRNQGNFQNRNQGNFQNRNQGNFQNRNQGNFQNKNQGQNKSQKQFQPRDNKEKQFDTENQNKESGAYRRIMNKRPNQEAGEGPTEKRQRVEPKEKKAKKEFVGVTAEKKKKHKPNKDLKKKKILSEILTKAKTS